MKRAATRTLIVGGVIALVAGILFVDPVGLPKGPSTLRPDDPKLTGRGQEIYAAHCASCHGAKLEGQPNWRQPDAAGRWPAPPHDASGHTWHHADELLVRLTKYGVAKAAGLKDHDSAMPAFEGVLSDAEIVAVLSWIKSQWPADIRAKHDQINRAAAQATKQPAEAP